MRLPRKRFTLRWLLALVAVSAVLMAGPMWAERSIRFARRAALHEAEVRYSEQFVRQIRLEIETPSGLLEEDHDRNDTDRMNAMIAESRRVADYWDLRVNYHTGWARIYRRAALCPWKSLPTGPLEPPLP